MQRRRIAAYGVCGSTDRILLARASARTHFPGRWQLPGGGLRHGEHPAAALVREFAEETGLQVEVTALRAVVADVIPLVDPEVALHTDRVVYEVRPVGGALRDEPAGTTDRVAWLPRGRWGALPMMPFTARLLAVPVVPLGEATAPARPAGHPEEVGAGPGRAKPAPRGQRFATYGLVTDPGGRVLLTQIAPGYPGAGRWHLPGGGTDHGEAPDAALRREIAEESGQVGRITELLDVSHRHDPAALGPEGHPVDWHVVRAVFRVLVAEPTEPVVTEAAGGSTLQAAWFAPEEVTDLATTEVVGIALDRLAAAA